MSFCRNLFAAKMMEGITAKCLGCERDVPLEDIRQHVHDCQEIEQNCGLYPAKFKRGDVLQQKSSAQKRRYRVPVGNNCSAKRNL